MPNPPTDILKTLDRWMRDPRPIHPRDADAIHLAQLEADGCMFAGDPVHGLTLQHVGLGCHGEYLAWATGCQPVQVYHQTQSTQDVCRRIVASQNPASGSDGSWGSVGTEHEIPRGPLVLSDEQTAGRGRLGRRWLAPPGQAALFSFATPTPAPGTPGSGYLGQTARGGDSPPSSRAPAAPSGGGERLALAAAVAVAEVLAEALSGTGHQPVIKWPNDTLVDGKKLAGVLIETEQSPGGGQVAIVGIGINVGIDAVDPSLVNQATSLHRLGSRVHRLALVADVVNALHRAANTDPADLLKRWRQRCLLPDSVQTLTHNGQTLTGHVIDLDPDHGLILRTQEGQVVYLPAATTSTKAMDD